MEDFNRLVAEILERVTAQVEAIEQANKPKLLIIGDCKEPYHDYPTLETAYDLVCDGNLDGVEVVMLFDFSLDLMSQLATGNCQSDTAKTVQEALLSGKKIYIPQNEVQLYTYAQSAPKAYYSLLLSQLELLENSGVVICPAETLADRILGQKPAAPAAPVAVPKAPVATESIVLDKKVITEKDMANCCTTSVGTIYIQKRAILTDLAKEYARSRKISIVRD